MAWPPDPPPPSARPTDSHRGRDLHPSGTGGETGTDPLADLKRFAAHTLAPPRGQETASTGSRTDSNVIQGPWDPRPHQNPDLPVVYLAGPYSIDVHAHNIHRGIQVADKVWASGLMMPFLPHLNGLWDIVSPRPPADWYALDLAFLRKCDALYRFDPHRESTGADRELAAARERGTPAFTDYEALLIWAKGLTV